MNLIHDKTFSFSVRLFNLHRELIQQNYDMTLFRQLLRSGTSIGANISEAQGAQSQKDFILKMSIAQKEAKEAKYWIRLFIETKMIGQQTGEELLDEITSIDRILAKILLTAKKNLNSKNSPPSSGLKF